MHCQMNFLVLILDKDSEWNCNCLQMVSITCESNNYWTEKLKRLQMQASRSAQKWQSLVDIKSYSTTLQHCCVDLLL